MSLTPSYSWPRRLLTLLLPSRDFAEVVRIILPPPSLSTTRPDDLPDDLPNEEHVIFGPDDPVLLPNVIFTFAVEETTFSCTLPIVRVIFGEVLFSLI